MLKLFVINKYLWQNIIEPIYNKLILGLNLFFYYEYNIHPKLLWKFICHKYII